MPAPDLHIHHDHDESREHLFGFPYWHFFDFGSDAARALIKPINRTMTRLAETHPEKWGAPIAKILPMSLKIARVLPFVGFIGEAAHAYTPFMAAREDWRHGRLCNAKFAGLSAMYVGYALSGFLGGASVVAKELLTYGVQGADLLDEKYVPHSLYSELEHTGLVKGLPSMQGGLLKYCPPCEVFHIGPEALSHLPSLPLSETARKKPEHSQS